MEGPPTTSQQPSGTRHAFMPNPGSNRDEFRTTTPTTLEAELQPPNDVGRLLQRLRGWPLSMSSSSSALLADGEQLSMLHAAPIAIRG